MTCCFGTVSLFAFAQLCLISYHSWLSACCSCSFLTFCLKSIFLPKRARTHRAELHFLENDELRWQGLQYLQVRLFLKQCATRAQRERGMIYLFLQSVRILVELMNYIRLNTCVLTFYNICIY